MKSDNLTFFDLYEEFAEYRAIKSKEWSWGLADRIARLWKLHGNILRKWAGLKSLQSGGCFEMKNIDETVASLKQIRTKNILGLPLSEREKALLALYGHVVEVTQ